MNRTARIVIAVGCAAAAALLGHAAAASGGSPPPPPRPNAAFAPQDASTGPAQPGTIFTPVDACRLVNTDHPFRAGTTRNYYVSGTTGFAGQGGHTNGCGIPASAVAVTVTLTARNSAGESGRLTAYPTGGAANGTTTLSYTRDHRVSSGATVQLGSGTGKRLAVHVYNQATNLAIDVTGYYAPQLAAFVDITGTLEYGSGRVLSATHPSTGNYLVTFDRDVSRCSFEVTPYAYNWTVAVGPQLGNVYQAHVYIHDQTGTQDPHDTSFFITAIC